MPASLDGSNQSKFWDRQFATESTTKRRIFDIAAGIVLPLFCLIVDPIVFRRSFGTPLLGNYRVVGLVATGIGMISLAAWMLFKRPAALSDY